MVWDSKLVLERIKKRPYFCLELWSSEHINDI